jgi:hypothetical protein
MRKLLLSFVVISLLVMSGLAFATVEIGSGDNAVIVGPRMGPEGLTPLTECIKVSTGSGTSASVGDVMVWDYSNAADGYHVARCSADDNDGTQFFAGVMLTSTSQDSAYSYSVPKANGPTVGYMAIRGLARAKVDSSTATAGMRLALNGSTLAASFTTYTTPAASVDGLSEDIGMLLEDVGGDGVMRVWLK